MRRKRKRWTKVVTYIIMFLTVIGITVYMTVQLRYDQPLKYVLNGSYTQMTEQQILAEVNQAVPNQGYLFLNTDAIETHLNNTQFFKTVEVTKGEYRVVNVFVEEKKIVMKQKTNEKTVLFDETGASFTTEIPTNVPLVDPTIKENDINVLAQAFAAQSTLLLQQISEITYSFVGEARTEMKLVTIQGDIIYVKLEEMKKKLPSFLEIDTIMNQKNILRCEYHFEYNNGSVVVNEMK